MPWIIGGAALLGGVLSSNAAGDAADTQAASADQATALQREQYNQTRTDNAPALEARNRSLARMQELLGISGSGGGQKPLTGAEVMADPGYQFGLQQGQQGIDRQATARGMRNSGAALMAAGRYGNDYATTKYGDAWNRQQGERTNQFNQLASVAGAGQVGANQVGQAGQNFATAAGNNMMSTANAQGAAGIASANAWTGGVNQLAGWYTNNQNRNALAGPSNAQLEAQWNGGGY